MADTAEDELNTEEPGQRGALNAPMKVASFVVLPLLAAGSLVFGQDDPSPTFVARHDRTLVPDATRPPISPAATSASRHVITKTPWQEALESGHGGPKRLDPAEVPAIARAAYGNAAAQLAARSPGCGVDWALLAAIGQVESDHGRHGGSSLRQDGTTTLPIRGVPLNGEGVALISDTDGGALDGDVVFDRALGPMQFLPGTWREVGADGNGDGLSAPDNIYDAALAAASYLCGGGDLTSPADAAAAVHRYNNSDSYVSTVLTLAERLRTTPTS
ncbi:lytic murein transglycosylase [Lentzea sp. NPDC051208]|uniref:lytic transglycosylase domain-containing protein n=1 Tax=Lentzea sp. NPDC051208 TaxID=3154642 RepID=UPI00342CF96E